MGWLWATNKKAQDKPSEDFQDQQQPLPPPSAEPSSPSETFPPLSPPSSDSGERTQQPRSPQQARYEYADAEFRAFFRDLAAEEQASLPQNELFVNTPFQKLFRGSRTPSTPSFEEDDADVDEPVTTTPIIPNLPSDRKITPQHLFPTTISCRAAFDQAFYCQSLGGQFNAVYRYGTIRDCNHLWSQFWFCVKTNRRRMSDEERQRKVMERYEMGEMKKYRGGPSSEDVWVQRTTMLIGAFEGDPDRTVIEEERATGSGRGDVVSDEFRVLE